MYQVSVVYCVYIYWTILDHINERISEDLQKLSLNNIRIAPRTWFWEIAILPARKYSQIFTWDPDTAISNSVAMDTHEIGSSWPCNNWYGFGCCTWIWFISQTMHVQSLDPLIKYQPQVSAARHVTISTKQNNNLTNLRFVESQHHSIVLECYVITFYLYV